MVVFGLDPLRDLMRDILRQNTTRNSTILARLLIDGLAEAAIRGDDNAGLVLKRYQLEGARRDFHRFLKAGESAVVCLSRNGEAVTMPVRYGFPDHDDSGAELPLVQQRLWWEESWEDVSRLMDKLRRQGTRLSRRAEAMAESLRLRKQYPDTATPLEAFERAGIDPHEFDARKVAGQRSLF